MNILILFSQPWKVGGAETHVEALLKGLAGNRILLAVNEGSDPARLARIKQDYNYVEILTIQARGANIFRWRNDINRLSALLGDAKIDVISAQQRTAGIWAYLLHRKTGITYTVTMHDPWHRALFKPIYKKIFPKMFVVSQNLAQKLITEFSFDPGSITLIDNGIDFSKFVPLEQADCRNRLNLAMEDKIILHVSRLSNVKGAVAMALIDSMEFVLKECAGLRLIIIGEGPMREEIDRKIEAFNQLHGAKIRTYNFVDKIDDWYNAADILVGEGRVAIETLACLKPVVAIRNTDTFIGAIRVNNIAYACDVNFDGKDQPVTTERLAEEIQKAFTFTRTESEQIAVYIKNRLSLEQMTKKYLTVFQQTQRE